jgi:hypothetical protein
MKINHFRNAIAAGVLSGVFLILSACSASGPKATADSAAGLVIKKSEITPTAKFIAYKSGDTSMEIIAVKAPDGTIRTSFNTCQVCFSSGRGYYKQSGDVLVCQNCGNQFKISQVEKEKGGCNPVPILENVKTDNGTTISLTKEYLDSNASLFLNWKTK